MKNFKLILLFVVLCAGGLQSCKRIEPVVAEDTKMLKALIIDGQNNHGVWPKTTAMMKDYLEQTGLFKVDVARTAFTWQNPPKNNTHEKQTTDLLEKYAITGVPKSIAVPDPIPDPDFKPDFSQYHVVISNFGWQASDWPKETQAAFEMYISSGGGFVLVHAADNSFGDWDQFNRIIGLGGWGGRNEKTGPYVYINELGQTVRDTTVGTAGSHGKQYPFLITVRDITHPITAGMPTRWLHAQDELYDRLRGPAEELTVLGTSFSDIEKNDSPFSELKGTNRNEPMMMTIKYGNGRVFHTPLGHADYSMECVGFITMFQRGTEWAATGKVTIPIPKDFPTADSISVRKWNK
ncbi:MAG: ThuA domain-containing protein [Chryseolinea sp.]